MANARRTVTFSAISFVAGIGLTLGWVRTHEPAPAVTEVSNIIAIAPPLKATLEKADALQRWIDNEILFREALKRGYALDDLIVRNQLQQRIRQAIQHESSQAHPSYAQLQTFLQQNLTLYQSKPRWSFEQIYLSRGAHGDRLVTDAAAIAAQLQKSAEDKNLGDPFPAGRVISNAPAVAITRDFGSAFTQQLSSLPLNSWQGPIESSLGLHFVRVTAMQPGRPMAFEEIRTRLVIDWREAQKQQALELVLTDLRPRYKVASRVGDTTTPMHDIHEEETP
ncbi:peptidyl-prolyl cis-trans isomerase [Stenotrophobium rhamnosiphilum]|uniref:peptidylprolyl isomerase n=1 Tax=Stenotrophobium rhamnosiphilum TaxID=2029166 RepID=A0A2T5MBF2_9GAMM|nr:peptidylprolyl isomerase [Stenotrophobium rhamnosiphilum]PTU29070.1 hypothetical protein CJD38_17065 [Stenotrophobium rhamnosiphilum]